MFFQSGSPNPSEAGEELIVRMAEQLGQLPNQLLIEGHTDARPLRRKEYSNWELSTDRANSARRIMEEHGLRPGQVLQVRGFANQNLRVKDDPEAASNRRVSVIVRYLPSDEPRSAAPSDEPRRAAGATDVAAEGERR
jgi:chemotaxis protein MotB